MSAKLPWGLMDLSRSGPEVENMLFFPWPRPRGGASRGTGVGVRSPGASGCVNQGCEGENVTKISAFIRRFELEHKSDKLHFIALHCASFLSHASDFTPGTIT